MPMTDAPNFGTKFGWRKPCLRYIGPLLCTTCDAPVGRGDHTPPFPYEKSRIPPFLRLPCVKGAVARRATEGLSDVAGPFGDDLCSDLHPSLATAGANAPLCTAGLLPVSCRGRAPSRPAGKGIVPRQFPLVRNAAPTA